jgi:hypothetical protein
MARVTRRHLVALCSTALLAVGLSSCSSSAALGNARTACRHIDTSLKTYRESTLPGLSGQETAALEAKAQAQLLAALAYAASATSDDGSYNALMTTIQEADRVPEGLLVRSLSRQCKIVQSNSPYLGI